MDRIDTIKNLYERKEIQSNKNDFYEKVADHFGLEISSVRVGWFNRFEIPKRYNVQEHLITYMQNFIAIQNGIPTISEIVK